jgi:hypothetical protein
MKKLAIAIAAILAATPALAETQTENIVAEQRTMVSLRAEPAAVQAFLPAGWTLAAAAGSPNLTLVFMDRALQLTPDGKVLNAGATRQLTFVVAGKNAAGQTRTFIVGGYTADPQGAPGAYKVYGAATIALTRTERVDAGATVEEHWVAKGADGSTVSLDLAFTRGVPTFSSSEIREYSAADPEFYRIYRLRQASEPLRNATVDHVKSVSLKASGGKIGAAIDGKQQIVSISQAPFYSRLTFVP